MTPASRPRSRLTFTAAVAVLLCATAAGCGTGGVDRSDDATGGKQLFVSKCGTCHTLADAGTTGKVGPDLDAAFGPSRDQGFKESTIRQIVRDQIHLPSPAAGSKGFPVMPADLVTGSDADAVAAYVASVAGVSTSATGTTTAPAPPPAPPPPVPATTTAPTTTAKTTTQARGGGDAAKGKSLFSSLACAGCHSIDGSKGVGPTLEGVFGSKVKLTNGQTVTADQAYLIESIEDPDKDIVQGYQPGIMSATIKPHQVAEADARDLVAYIQTLK